MWRIKKSLFPNWCPKRSAVPSVDPSSTTRIFSKPASNIPSITETIRVASLYERMRKRMLFLDIGIVNILECKFPSHPCQFFMIGVCFSQKKKHKIEEKCYSCIDQDICTSSNTKKMSYEIECCRNKCKEKESSANSEKDEKMQGIKSLSPRNIIGSKENNETWDDEKYLKKCHGEMLLESGWSGRSCACRGSSWLHLLEIFQWNRRIEGSTFDFYSCWNLHLRRDSGNWHLGTRNKSESKNRG